MKQRSFFIKVIIGSILIGIVVAANYCQLCRNHVGCRPRRGFARACGNKHAIVPMDQSHRNLILQIHNGMRSLIASGLLRGYKPAKRMGYIQWNSELAKLAAINARECRVHYDKCRKTVKFPWVGQNVGIDNETYKYRDVNQSIYRITLKWFRQFELANATAMESFHIPTNPRNRFHNFAVIVHDRQTHIGCAAVKYHKGKFYHFYLVCNYSMHVLRRRKVYEAGIPYAGCIAGRSLDYPSICAKNEPITAVAYPDNFSTQIKGRTQNRRKWNRNRNRNRNSANQTQGRTKNRNRNRNRNKKRQANRQNTGWNQLNIRPNQLQNQIQTLNRPNQAPFSFFMG